MKLSYINRLGNKGNTFVAHNISTDSLSYQANSNNIHQYLIPDYFLPASQSESYYSKKYSDSIDANSNHQQKHSKISRVASMILLSLGFIATAVEVEASDNIELQKEASSGKKQEVTFAVTHLSNNLPDLVPQLPLPDLIPSNPPVTPPPPPPMPRLPSIVPPVILPDVVPAPPAPPMALSQPNLVSDATFQTKPKSGFMAAMKEIAKGNFKLKKVQEEPKPVIISDDKADFMSQILARREAIAGEKKNKKFKKAAKGVIVLTAEEQKAREDAIAKQIAENKEKAATLRKQKGAEWEANRKKILAEVEVENQRRAAEEAKAIRKQKAKENGSDSSIVIAGIDPVLHNNIVADLRSEISSLKEQLTLNSHVTAEGINSVESVNPIRSKRSLEDSKIFDTKDQSTSTEDASLLEDRLFDSKLETLEFEEDEAMGRLDEVISAYSDSDSGYDKSLEDSDGIGSINGSDTNNVVSRIVPQSNSIVSETVQAELADVEQELQSQELKEEESVEAVEDILGEDSMTVEPEDFITDTGGIQADTNISPARPKEDLARRANIIAKVKDDVRFGSKLVSKQIRHRLLTRDIVNLVAVSAGDAEQDIEPSYSVWSSGIFGASKQKDSSNIIGHSSKIHGGTIGGEINVSSDLMFGVSYSILSSKFKYPSMLDSDKHVIRTNTNIFSIYSSSTLATNTNLQTLASVALSGKDAKQKYIIKPKSKLFSFESHLNHKITFQNNITLIPSIGFRYEYGRSSASNNQILSSYIEHHERSNSSTLSGEVGARVLFTPINLSSDFKLIPTVHISLEKRIVGRGINSGQLLSVKDIGKSSSVSFTNNLKHEKLNTNIGCGLIASHKNISLELSYDLQKQRSFKSHQAVVKLKVNL